MGNLYFLVAVSLLSGIPLNTNAFKYGKFSFFEESALRCSMYVHFSRSVRPGCQEGHLLIKHKKAYNFFMLVIYWAFYSNRSRGLALCEFNDDLKVFQLKRHYFKFSEQINHVQDIYD